MRARYITVVRDRKIQTVLKTNQIYAWLIIMPFWRKNEYILLDILLDSIAEYFYELCIYTNNK